MYSFLSNFVKAKDANAVLKRSIKSILMQALIHSCVWMRIEWVLGSRCSFSSLISNYLSNKCLESFNQVTAHLMGNIWLLMPLPSFLVNLFRIFEFFKYVDDNAMCIFVFEDFFSFFECDCQEGELEKKVIMKFYKPWPVLLDSSTNWNMSFLVLWLLLCYSKIMCSEWNYFNFIFLKTLLGCYSRLGCNLQCD